ncbi:MAG: FG-GAP-like repeat-containing protein, partial [Elusimicrobiota bacterium]|nr:FG-GAP-like repeat-containing protein [Elusimicrobiota bacterium]
MKTRTVPVFFCAMSMSSFCFAVSAPAGLLCNNKTNPVCIESPEPAFEWSASTQVAYRLLVSEANDFGSLKWDTGITTSSVKSCVYAGSPLSGNTTYYWKVRVSSASGEYSQYSDTGTLRMNLFLKKSPIVEEEDLNEFEDMGSIGVGDLDNDGDTDIVFGGKGTQAMTRFYRNDGGGSFTQIFSTQSGKELGGVIIRDFNNDGLNDVLAVAAIGEGAANQSSVVLINEGNFVFHAGMELNAKKTFSAACFDFNRDGECDIVEGLTTGGGDGEQNTFYAGQGNGLFSAASTFGDLNETNSLAAADFDNDGYLDIVVMNYKNDTNATKSPLAYAGVYKGNGSGEFSEAPDWESPAPDYFNAAGVGDFNGDGLCDFIAATRGASSTCDLTQIGIYINGGNMTFTKDYSVGGPRAFVTSLAVADLDNDGDLDFIAGWYRLGAGDKTRVYINDGTGDFAILDETENSVYAQGVAVADFDNDGDLDYAACHGEGAELYYSTLSDDDPNGSPSAPSSGMGFDWEAGRLHLYWGTGTDAETSDNLLQYDLALRDDSGNVIVSTTAGTVFAECSGFYGNMIYSSWTLLDIPRQTYFFSVISLDAQGGRSAPSAEITVNEKSYPGWEGEHVLLSTCTHSYTLEEILLDSSKKGVVITDFKLKDFENNTCSLKDLEYSLDAGSSWTGVDGSLVCTDFDSSFASADSLSASVKHTFFWKTNNPSNPAVVRSTQCDSVKLRFRSNDGYTDSDYCVSGIFEIDNERPTVPGDLVFSEIYTSDSVTLDLGAAANDVNFDEYRIYYNDDPVVNDSGDSLGSWTAADDINMDAEDYNGASSVTVTGLAENTTYYFRIYAYDTFGNGMGSDGAAVAATNDRPVLIAVSVSQRNDGSGNVDFLYSGADSNIDAWEYVSPWLKEFDGTQHGVSSNTADAQFSDPLYFCSSGCVNTFVFNALDDNGQFYYHNAKITLIISDGIDESDRVYSSYFDIDTLPPSGITRFRERAHDSSHVQLQWNLNDDDTSIAVVEDTFLEYIVYYSTAPGVNETCSPWGKSASQQPALGEMGTRIANVGELSSGTRYYFRLYIYDSFGNKYGTDEISVVTGEGPSSLMENAPEQSSSGDGVISARILCSHPDDFDSYINVCFSTSGSGAGASWHAVTFSTDVTAFYFDGAFYPLTPPGVDNAQYFQIGTALKPVITSSGTRIALDVEWESAVDLPGALYENVFLRIVVRDEYNVEQFSPALSDPFIVDNLKPVPESASYSHGTETYGENSAEFIIYCNKSADLIAYDSIYISTKAVFPDGYSSSISLDEDEFDSVLSSSTLYFRLSEDKWHRIALLGRDAEHLYIHCSSAAITDAAGNVSGKTSFEIVWSKDNNPPAPENYFYAQNNSDPAKLSGFRIQFSDELSGWADGVGGLLTVYTAKSGPEITVSFEDGVTIATAAANIFWFYPSEEKHLEILNLGVTDLYLACGALGYDYSGNWLNSISRENALLVPLTRETSAPWIMDYAPSPDVKTDVSPDIRVRFNESMYSDSVTGANIYLTKITDSHGDSVFENVPAAINYVSSSCVVDVSPYSLLEYGCGYRVTVTTAVCDLSLNKMLA